jgi:hypothetical protein
MPKYRQLSLPYYLNLILSLSIYENIKDPGPSRSKHLERESQKAYSNAVGY